MSEDREVYLTGLGAKGCHQDVPPDDAPEMVLFSLVSYAAIDLGCEADPHPLIKLLSSVLDFAVFEPEWFGQACLGWRRIAPASVSDAEIARKAREIVTNYPVRPRVTIPTERSG